MFIGFNLRMQIEYWSWLILKSVSQPVAAREASGHCMVDGTVLVIVWYWQTCVVPTHAQSCYSAHLFCHCTVIGRRANIDIEVEFRKGLWVHFSCIIQVFMKRLTPSLPILRGKCSDWTRRSALYRCTMHSVVYLITHTHAHTHIQGVPGGMCQTSGECSLC